MATYLLSDLHLRKDSPHIKDALLDFLSTNAKQADAIYVLGDLFEYWVGDDAADRLGVESVLDAFKRVTTTVKGYFIPGNRDFLVRDSFAQQTGLTILQDETVIDLYGEPTLLLHGDSLCTDDIKHQQFRQRIMLNRRLGNLFLKLPLRMRLKQAQKARAKSQQHKMGLTSTIMDVNEQAVLSTFKQHGVKRMIHGHTHRQHLHHYQSEEGQCARHVLGDWGKTNSIMRVDRHSIEMINQIIK